MASKFAERKISKKTGVRGKAGARRPRKASPEAGDQASQSKVPSSSSKFTVRGTVTAANGTAAAGLTVVLATAFYGWLHRGLPGNLDEL
jgi:hypothetical protein